MIQYILHFLLFTTSINLSNQTKALDKFYLDWKRTTIQSLTQRANNTKDSLKKNTYINRTYAVNTEEGTSAIDTMSSRYLLLKDQFINIISSKEDVFVIEIKTIASAIILTDLIIYKGSNKLATVDALRYNGKKWIITKQISCDTNFLQENLSDYYLEDLSGINFDETIITKVSKGKLIMSEYYTMKALSSKCGLQKIFDLIDPSFYKIN